MFVIHWLSKHWDHETVIHCLKINRAKSCDWRRFLVDLKATATQKGVVKKKTLMFIADAATKFDVLFPLQ